MQPSIASSLPAFSQHWPEAELLHLLDDSLARDVSRTGVDVAIVQRLVALARYARDDAKCSALLFTCSAFGVAIEEVQRQMRTALFPVLKPNQAMMEEAAKRGQPTKEKQAKPIAVLSIFEPTLPSITRELMDLGGKDLHLIPRFVPGALEALQNGEEAQCIQLIAEAAETVVESAQQQGQELACLAFAMFSMARARQETVDRLQKRGGSPPPVLTSPDSAVRHLRALFGS